MNATSAAPPPGRSAVQPPRRRGVMPLLLVAACVAVASFVAGAASGIDPSAVLAGLTSHEPHAANDSSAWPPRRDDSPDRPPWDGSITVTEDQQRAMGVRIAAVTPQAEPLRLEVQGKTDYNPDTLLKVRPRFDALVLAVHAAVGQRVKKGDPLVDLYSVRLAQAKLEYESKQSQADHDNQIADHQRDLVRQGVIPNTSRVLLDAENLERRSRLEFKLARDELEVYGVPPDEIAQVHLESGTEKAKMTLRSPGNGTVISRDVVVGNIYDQNDTLMVISSIEELWVWGNVYERDLSNVQAGLPWEIHFPFSKEVVRGTIDYVANQVDPQTRALRIRGAIPNPDGHLKSDQLVRAYVMSPPRPGSTVIPRRSVVVESGGTSVFVRRPGTTDVFERRSIELDHELSDTVIVSQGLAPGEDIVAVGAIVMAQIYEDRLAAETGETM